MESKSSRKEVTHLIEAKRLEKIPYADKPLPQGGDIQYLTPEVFETKFSFSYSECLSGDKKALSQFLNDPTFLNNIKNRLDLPKEAAVLERLASPLETLVVCDMGSEVGYGLFASEDIPPDTILFLYSGVIESIAASGKVRDDYSYIWGDKTFPNLGQSINPEHQGGLARFCQHLPIDPMRHKIYIKEELKKHFGPALPDILKARNMNLDDFIDNDLGKQFVKDVELDSIQFKDSKLKSQIATSNVELKFTVIKGIPAVVCFTVYGIKKHEQIGFSYGPKYLEGMMKFKNKKLRHFNLDGSLVPLSAYEFTSSSLSTVPEISSIGREVEKEKPSATTSTTDNQAQGKAKKTADESDFSGLRRGFLSAPPRSSGVPKPGNVDSKKEKEEAKAAATTGGESSKATAEKLTSDAPTFAGLRRGFLSAAQPPRSSLSGNASQDNPSNAKPPEDPRQMYSGLKSGFLNRR